MLITRAPSCAIFSTSVITATVVAVFCEILLLQVDGENWRALRECCYDTKLCSSLEEVAHWKFLLDIKMLPTWRVCPTPVRGLWCVRYCGKWFVLCSDFIAWERKGNKAAVTVKGSNLNGTAVAAWVNIYCSQGRIILYYVNISRPLSNFVYICDFLIFISPALLFVFKLSSWKLLQKCVSLTCGPKVMVRVCVRRQ